MSETKVKYNELLPAEFRERLKQRPLAYLPLGTLEWHGEHLPLGADAIISEDLMVEAARRYGGIVMPPIHIGPDRNMYDEDGLHLQGMDLAESTDPPRQLPGSCYWIPIDLFSYMIDCMLVQFQRAGFRAVFADGHGPSRYAWVTEIAEREENFDLRLLGVTEEYGNRWRSQMDHAALNETSLLMLARPDLVDLSRLPESRTARPEGVSGCDPRDATAEHGRKCRETSLRLLAEMLEKANL